MICEKELRHYLGDRCILKCTRSSSSLCTSGRIDRDYLAQTIQDFDQHFYVCGPPGFVDTVNDALHFLGADPESVIYDQ